MPRLTAARTIPIAVSMPLIPLLAQPNSTCLSTSVCGAWSVAMASAVPSTSAARQAAASSAERSGGLTRRAGVEWRRRQRAVGPGSRAVPSLEASHDQRRDPAIHSSVRPRWCGVTSQVTGRPAAFAARTGVERGRRGDVRQVQPRTRHLADDAVEDRDRTRDRGRLRGDRPALEAEDRRDVPVGRLGALGERHVLRVVDDRQAERARVRERAAQDRAPDRRAVVAEPTTPASASSSSAASVSPPRLPVTAPWTRTRTGDPDAAAAA